METVNQPSLLDIYNSSLIGAFVIFFTDYTSAESKFDSVVPGVKFVCQNLFILLSRFAKISF